MFGALKDLWASERGIVAIALIGAATVLAGMSVISADQWLDYSKWIFVTYVAGKTVTTAAATIGANTREGQTNMIDGLFGMLKTYMEHRPVHPPPAPPAPVTVPPTPPPVTPLS